MLRIESYITPIILSYVEKYVKNLKAEDSQVSLWGGDAVFNNLDLRLDVLERELCLPFTFVNGHIHELRIHVPWTKLTSEPIVITINTIECILKLKDGTAKHSDTSSQNAESISIPGDTSRTIKSTKPEIEAPTSYVQALINRIINNICIVCDNVVLKYVEDDIVLSVHVKTLELRSVDQRWLPAFVDLTPDDLALRNLIILSDIIVCLDKRNAMGKIENYQDPMLSRCSLSCRFIRQFESVNFLLPIMARLDVFGSHLNFSLSDTQLPMFWRLVQLAMALHRGHLRNPVAVTDFSVPEPKIQPEESVLEDSVEDAGESWSSWAWSLGSSLLPLSWEEEDKSFSSYSFKMVQFLKFGIFIESITWTFKVKMLKTRNLIKFDSPSSWSKIKAELTESVQKRNYFGPTTMCFTPFLRVEQQGSFLIGDVKGVESVIVNVGISRIRLVPLEYCVCGILDGNQACNEDTNLVDNKYSLISVGEVGQEYLIGSLFHCENDSEMQSGDDLFWNLNPNTSCESSLLTRTTAFALGYTYSLELPSEIDTEILSDITNDLENSNCRQSAICTILIGSTEAHVTSGLEHRLQAVLHGLLLHEYAPYSLPPDDTPPFDRKRPSSDEISRLQLHIPLFTVFLRIKETQLVLHMAEHPQLDVRSVFSARRRRANRKANIEVCAVQVSAVPRVRVDVSRIDFEFIQPLYAKRLVSVVSMLKSPPVALLNNCHSSFSVKINKCCLNMDHKCLRRHIADVSSASASVKFLFFPLYWNSVLQSHTEYFGRADGIELSVCVAQILLLHQMMKSWLQERPCGDALQESSLINDAISSKRFNILLLKVDHLESKMADSPTFTAFTSSLASVNLCLVTSTGNLICPLVSGPENRFGADLTTEAMAEPDKLIKCVFQYAKAASNLTIPTILYVDVQKMAFLVDPEIFRWLKYSPMKVTKDSLAPIWVKKIRDVRRSNDRTSDSAESETTRVESSTATVSEKRAQSPLEISTLATWQTRLADWHSVLRQLCVRVEIDTMTVMLPVNGASLNLSSSDNLVNAVHRAYLTRHERAVAGDTTVLCLPRITLQNATPQRTTTLRRELDIPVILSDVWSPGREWFPWALQLHDCNAYSLQGLGHQMKLPILKKVNTTTTLAITTKYQGSVVSQLGLVIHTDMSPLDFSGNHQQVESHITLLNNAFSLLQHFQNCVGEGSVNQTSSLSTVPLEVTSQPTQFVPLNVARGASCTKTEPSNDIEMSAEVHTEEVADSIMSTESEFARGHPTVTSWIQWTVARISASLYFMENPGRERKLRAEFEDLTTSVDFQQIYSKVKVKVIALNVMHFIKSNNKWTLGEHEGIIFSCGEKISSELKLLKPGDQQFDFLLKSSSEGKTKNHGFLSVTITSALCKNIHSRWNQLAEKLFAADNRTIRTETCGRENYLNEVDIRIQKFDMIFDPSTLYSFCSIYEPWLNVGFPTSQKNQCKENQMIPWGLNLNNQSLPLFYLNTDVVRVFLPTTIPDETGGTPGKNSNKYVGMDCSSRWAEHNYLLIHVESVVVTPQVDNALSRLVVRSDVYNAADQAGILRVPGAQVEDRQYQIDVQGFSICSGDWKELVSVKSRSDSLAGKSLGLMGENPALEWSNFDPSLEAQNREVVLYPFVNRIDTRVLIAPAIVYDNSCIGEPTEVVLVAGHSMEVNVTSDVELHLSISQIILLESFIKDLYNVLSNFGKNCQPSEPTLQSSSELLDSGVDCEVSSLENSQWKYSALSSRFGLPTHPFVPLEFLITGRCIVLSYFDRTMISEKEIDDKKTANSLKSKGSFQRHPINRWNETASTESEASPVHCIINVDTSCLEADNSEAGYEGSEEGSVCEDTPLITSCFCLIPLLYVAISQPHAFLSCQASRQRLEISCFDFAVNSAPLASAVKVCPGKQFLCKEDFTSAWLESKPGDPHPKTGIPPAFLVISLSDFLNQPVKVQIDIGRPLCTRISSSRVSEIQRVMNSLEIVSCFDRECDDQISVKTDVTHNIVGPSLYNKVKNYLSFVEKISIVTSQIVVHFDMPKKGKLRSELITGVSGFSFFINVVRKKGSIRPIIGVDNVSEIVFNVKVCSLQVKCSYNSMKCHSFLKPLTADAELKLTWMLWSLEPFVELICNSEMIMMEIGPEHLCCLWDMLQWWQTDTVVDSASSEGSNAAQTPADTCDQQTDIVYQDDLRAGIFQYITVPLDDPRPYQVLFDKVAGTMVWCYPEPRSLIRIDIFPVPFIPASELSTTDSLDKTSTTVSCALQYYDSLSQSFVTYLPFQLSESKYSQLELPVAVEKHQVAISNVWRVCINFCEDFMSDKNGLIVSPVALAACMRVDSMFSAKQLSTIQCVMKCGHAQLNLVNHLSLTGKQLPRELQMFILDGLQAEEQHFATVIVENIFLRSHHLVRSTHFKLQGSIQADVLNYQFLTDLCLLESTFVGCRISVQETEFVDKINGQSGNYEEPVCFCNLIVQPIFIHISQSTVHTLNIAYQSWYQSLQALSDNPDGKLTKAAPAILMTHYIICNNTVETLRFGQVATEENICLRSRCAHLYSWRSHKKKPQLQICIDGGHWRWFEPLSLHSVGTQIQSIAHNGQTHHLVIVIKKLGKMHRSVQICGLVSIANLLSDVLEVEVMRGSRDEVSLDLACRIQCIPCMSSGASYPGKMQSMRVRVAGTRSRWSTEIPLIYDRTRQSHLLKIPPHVAKGKGGPVWCHILHQKIGSLTRLLVVISPQYVVKSHLPHPLILHINSANSSVTNQLIVNGRGQTRSINIDSGSGHQLTFQLDPKLDVSSPPVPLNKWLAEQLKPTQMTEFLDIDQYLETLRQNVCNDWPYVDTTICDHSVIADQPKIDLQINYGCVYPFCNTVMVEVLPWSLIINSTTLDLLFQEGNEVNNTWAVPAGGVFAPSKLSSTFRFGLIWGTNSYFSQPFRLSNEGHWYTVTLDGCIPREGSYPFVIPAIDVMCLITVRSSLQKSIQVLNLVPTYTVSNNTGESLTIRPLAIHPKARSRRQLPTSVPLLEICCDHCDELNVLEIPLLLWQVISDRQDQSSTDLPLCCIQLGSAGFFSPPIPVGTVAIDDQRLPFTLPHLSSLTSVLNRPFVVTIHKYCGQLKMVVQVDPVPQMVIHNGTLSLIIVGQSCTTNNGGMEEEWDAFGTLPSVPAGRAIHYTFPYVTKTFPDILSNGSAYPYLHLSHADIMSDEVLWSQGIDVKQHFDQFVSVPGHGDVRVHLEQVGDTTHVYVDPVSRVEFSARDVRSRIAAMPSKSRLAMALNKQELELTGEGLIKGKGENSLVNAMKKVHSKKEKYGYASSVWPPCHLNVSCNQIVLVLHDDSVQCEMITEILRVTADHVALSVTPKVDVFDDLTALNHRFRECMEVFLFVGGAQVDNQCYLSGKFDFPVILISQDPISLTSFPSYESVEFSLERLRELSLLCISMELEKSADEICCRSLQLTVRPIVLFAEDTLFYYLLDVLGSFLPDRTDITTDSQKFGGQEFTILPPEVLVRSNILTHPIRIGSLTIDPIYLIISLRASIKLYISLDQSPLYFAAFRRTDILTTSYVLGHKLSMHYLSGALIRAGWVVGSLDLLGNPGGFARMLGTGVKDFVQLPYQGILRGPWAFLSGVTHGSLSLISHVTAGTVVSVTNLASSVARNMERLSFDSDHASRSEAKRRLLPSGLATGIMQGFSSFGIAMLGAIGGLAQQPMEALLADGANAASVLGGVGKGLVGVVTKPIGGAADLLVHTGHGLLQGTGWHHNHKVRFTPQNERRSVGVNSMLKAVWKLMSSLQSQEDRVVMAAIDATYVSPGGFLAPVTICVTRQLFSIISTEEDVHQHTIPLTELNWKPHLSDTSLIIFEKKAIETSLVDADAEPISGCPERVADYVLSTCSEGGGLEGDRDSEGSDVDLETENSCTETPLKYRLHVSPRVRSFLLEVLQIASRATQGRGFVV